MNGNGSANRRLIVLGSTGSIGVNTLNVVEYLRRHQHLQIEVVGLAAGRRADKLVEQARRFNVRNVAIADTDQAGAVGAQLPDAAVRCGSDGSRQLVESIEATDVCAAVVGSAGLPATIAAATKGATIGLANKETLVAAGALITPLVHRHKAHLIPVDSEHSAIFQCIHGEKPAGNAIKRIVLTASGGPFRSVDKKAMDNATVEQALAHPTWKMGPKITIDSATMMNKALEVIEAHWLFGLPARKIDVIIHPQSVVHSFVEFEDHSILAQLGPPDMRTPIQYALTYPKRPPGCSRALDWAALSKLEFEQPDLGKFRALSLAYDVIEAGQTAGAVMNAANEAAVAAFLDGRIRFGRIVELVESALGAIEGQPVESLEAVLDADRRAREHVQDSVNRADDT